MAKVKIYVSLKKGIADPQGLVVKQALHNLGYNEAEEVRMGKFLEIRVKGQALPAGRQGLRVKKRVKEMCEKLLVNPIIESYEFEVIG